MVFLFMLLSVVSEVDNTVSQERKGIQRIQAEKHEGSISPDSISDSPAGEKGDGIVKDREEFKKTMSRNLIKSGVYIFLIIAFLFIVIYFLRKKIRDL